MSIVIISLVCHLEDWKVEVVLFSCWLQLAELNSTLLTVLALSLRGGGGGGRDMSPRPHLNIGSVSSPSS